MGQINILKNVRFDKVSCICVTRNRARLLEKSIRCFKNQSFSNKELVILYYSDDFETKKLAVDTNVDNVFFHEYDVSEGLSLGELRNRCVSLTTGDYICVWDDDDWFDSGRILKQYVRLMYVDKAACLLKQLVIYDYETDEMFFTLSRSEGWEGSMLCKKEELLNHPYGDMDRHEDTHMLTQLHKKDKIYPIDDPTIYVYFFHSNNTSNREHLEKMKEQSEPLTESQEKIVRGCIREYIEDYKLIKDA